MQAAIIEGFGAATVFRAAEVPVPSVRAGQVLIRVAATSVNPLDYKIRRGEYPALAPEAPTILHGDVCGTIEEIGPEVTQFKVGDTVYGCVGGVKGHSGALAQFMLADARLLAKKPQTLDSAQAAALPLVSITAWEALVERARLRAGQTVLIHAGAGGVGHVALQLAKARGARVFVTASTPEKQNLARQLGADGVIDYRRESVEQYVATHTGGAGFDVVFDTVGGEVFVHALAAARLRGQVVSIFPAATYDLSPVLHKALSVHGVFMLLPLLTGAGRAAHGEILTEIARLVDAGKIRPHVDASRFQLHQIAAAHAFAESGKQIGKVVVTIP